MTKPLAAVTAAREEFLASVETIRPELHRYCARLTGSVIEGEDIVQETLARAFYALGLATETPPLRPWLFRIAHNAAVDWLKSHGERLTDPHADMADVVGFEDVADPAIVRAAIARFLTLPVIQRSAVILKDVLGHSLEETAQTMETTVMAVKAALVRGRARLCDELKLGVLEGELVLGAYPPGAQRPAYFILLAWADGKVQRIRDFRYVPYIAAEADFVEL
jgi:RNA polymerase sigma-70 factor (ECF subfamily)